MCAFCVTVQHVYMIKYTGIIHSVQSLMHSAVSSDLQLASSTGILQGYTHMHTSCIRGVVFKYGGLNFLLICEANRLVKLTNDR